MLKVKGCTKILYLENPLLVCSIKKFMKLKNESADSFFFFFGDIPGNITQFAALPHSWTIEVEYLAYFIISVYILNY